MVKQKIICTTKPEVQLICIIELYHIHMYMLLNEMNDMPNNLIKLKKLNAQAALVHAKLVMCLIVSSFRMMTEYWGRLPY